MPTLSSNLTRSLSGHGFYCRGSCSVAGHLTFGAPVIAWHGVSLTNTSLMQYSYANGRTSIAQARIGRYCSIAHDVTIGLLAHPLQNFTTSSMFKGESMSIAAQTYLKDPYLKGRTKIAVMVEGGAAYQNVLIGHDVWIGARALVVASRPLVIGTGAVIGAGSVVTKDVPPYAIVAGNPAKIIKMRFKESIIERLIKSRWWHYNLPLYTAAGHTFPWNDVEGFLSFMDDVDKSTLPVLSNRALQLVSEDGNKGMLKEVLFDLKVHERQSLGELYELTLPPEQRHAKPFMF